jgi:uncharacterized repeat protein (TIGR01451 family)
VTDTTTGRTVRLWAAALLAGTLAAMVALLVALGGGAAGAQESRAVDLDLKKTVSPKTVQVGEVQTFTIRITNEGTTRAEGVRMRDPLPSKVRFIRASTSREVPGSCGIADRVVTCRLGNLGPDKTVTVKIYVKPVVAGSYTNRAYVSHTNPAGLQLEDSDAAQATAEARPDAASTECTIKGTSGQDSIQGTDKRDVICGFGSDDAIQGMGGDDLVRGGGGGDSIQGGKGDDTLKGQDGNDTLQGQEGDDKLYGGKGTDVLQGGSGKDERQQ